MPIELANTLVTEWVKWQQHFIGGMVESPPRPAEKSVNPEERPKFEENLDYETHSEHSQKNNETPNRASN